MESSNVTTLRLIEKTDSRIVAGIPGTNYQLHLNIGGPLPTEAGHRVKGIVTLNIYKVDRLQTSSNFIEPVLGRPRRVHGHVAGHEAGGNAILLTSCGRTFRCVLPAAVEAASLPVGAAVGLDVLPGASFQPAA